MKNSADQGGCYPQRPKAEVDNTLRGLQNSSYPKAEFNNCFIIHSKYFLLLKGVSPLRSLFFRSPNATLSPGFLGERFNNFWRHWFNMATILSKFGEQQLLMVNYACGLSQSETGKYFKWIIKTNIALTWIVLNYFNKIMNFIVHLINKRHHRGSLLIKLHTKTHIITSNMKYECPKSSVNMKYPET